jgi:site-specific DNA recombinase
MNYIIYARKSSESEDRQSLSIQSQIIEMQEIAKREKLHVVKIFQESKSAKAPGRPIFAEMIQFIQSGKAEGILCWKIDRLARNPVDEGTIKWFLQNNTIKRITTFDRDYNPEDNVVIASIEFSMANQYVRDLSNNVKRGLAAKVRRGEYPGNHVLGYTIDPKTKLLKINRKIAPYIKQAFELYATKHWSVRKICDKLYADGFRSVRGQKVNHARLHRILTNPLYCGLFEWNKEVHKGVHPPLISRALYDEAQKNLYPERYLKIEAGRFFLFRGLAVCGECGLKITAEVKKGHTYYRCTKSRGVEQCSQPYLREEAFIEKIGEELKKIQFDDEVLGLIRDAAKEKYIHLQQNDSFSKKEVQKLLAEVLARKDSLVEKYIDNTIPKSIYEKKLSEIVKEESLLEERLSGKIRYDESVLQDLDQIVHFVKNAHDIFQKGTPTIQREVVSLLSSNLGVRDRKIAYFNLNEPFSWLVEDVSVLSAQNETFEPPKRVLNKRKTAPVGTACSDVRIGRDSNPRPLA